jgi:hypothetical protein
MSFKLSDKDRLEKTELAAEALEKHIVVCAQIDAFNVMLAAARESIEGSRKDYAAAVAKLQGFTAKTARKGRKALTARPQQWQESEAGQNARDWVAFYEAFQPEVPTIDYPQDIERLDESLLSDYEELPDNPF